MDMTAKMKLGCGSALATLRGWRLTYAYAKTLPSPLPLTTLARSQGALECHDRNPFTAFLNHHILILRKLYARA
jgi:hypothetical protein